MTTFVAHPERETRWEHLLLGLRDPQVRVALVTPEPIEPAVLAYYLELVGVGPWGRLALFECADEARRFAAGDEAPAAIDARFAHPGTGAATVHVQLHEDGRVQVLAAQQRLATGARYPAPATDALFRAAARVGARLVADGASGRFAVDLDADGEPVGIDPGAANHAYATLLALRANAFRADESVPVHTRSWREVVQTLRDTGVAWNPLARAGVVAFGLDDVARTGRIGLVALGNARTEAEERFSTAVDALTHSALVAA